MLFDVFAIHYDNQNVLHRYKVYSWSYGIEFPISQKLLEGVDVITNKWKHTENPFEQLRQELMKLKRDLPHDNELLPVHDKLDHLKEKIKIDFETWFNNMISRQIATTGREIPTIEDVVNFCDLFSQIMKFNPNAHAFNYMLENDAERSKGKFYSRDGINRLIIASRDLPRQKWRDILYGYILNYYHSSIKMRDIMRIDRFGQYIPPLDEDDSIHYLIINTCDNQFITSTKFHSKLRREFIKLIYLLKKDRTISSTHDRFLQECFIFMETFVRAALYRKFLKYHTYVDKSVLLYPSVTKLDKFNNLEHKISKETTILSMNRLAYKQFILVGEVGSGLYYKSNN